jgi:hypothetical protein
MVIRILRFLLVAAVASAAVVYGTPMSLVSTPKVESAVHEVSAKDLQVTCTGPTFIAGGKNQTSVSSFKRSSTASGSLSYSAVKNTSLKGQSSKPVIGFGVRQDLTKRLGKFTSFTVLDQTGKTLKGLSYLLLTRFRWQRAQALGVCWQLHVLDHRVSSGWLVDQLLLVGKHF